MIYAVRSKQKEREGEEEEEEERRARCVSFTHETLTFTDVRVCRSNRPAVGESSWIRVGPAPGSMSGITMLLPAFRTQLLSLASRSSIQPLGADVNSLARTGLKILVILPEGVVKREWRP